MIKLVQSSSNYIALSPSSSLSASFHFQNQMTNITTSGSFIGTLSGSYDRYTLFNIVVGTGSINLDKGSYIYQVYDGSSMIETGRCIVFPTGSSLSFVTSSNDTVTYIISD